MNLVVNPVDDPDHRAVRSGEVSGGDSGSAADRLISPLPGEAAIYTEGRWEAAAIGDPQHPQVPDE